MKAKVAADKTMAERFQWIDLENRAESFIAATLRRAAMAVIGAHEGLASPLEAMACGTIPCGFPGYDGPAEFVTDDNGIGPRPLTPTKSSKACNAPPRSSPNRPASNRCARPDKNGGALSGGGDDRTADRVLVRPGAANTPYLNPRPPSPPGL